MARFLIALAVSCCLVGGTACTDNGPKDAKYWGSKLIKDPKLREQAVSELKKLKDPACVPDLIAALKIDGDHRGDVAFLLGELKDKSAVPALVAGIDYAVGAGRDKESKSKNSANTKIAEALGKIGDMTAAEPLIKMLKSRDQYVQLAAVRALGVLKAPQAVEPLMDITENNENNFMIKNAIMSLGDIGDAKAIPLLIKMMFFERGVSFYRESSYALFQFGRDAVPALLDAYEGKNEQVASLKLDPAVAPAKVAVVLGDIGDPRGLPVIRKIATFDDEQSPMGMGPLARANAMRALGLIGDKGAVAILKNGLFEIDVSMREFPTEALGLVGDRGVCPDLFKAASHEPYWTDCKKAGYDDEACKNSEWEVRQLSSEWLSRLCDQSYTDKFKQMLDGEKEERVKRMLEVDMARLDAAKECTDKADCWVGKLKTFAAEGANKDLVAQAARIRDKAGFELSYLADPKTAPALLDALQDPDLEARFAIAVALLRLLPKDGADKVEKILDDEYGKATYIKVNEDLKRLAVKMRRGY
ncbi:MAG: HEAT repeat domain-containing protein [Pseudomonadota bacterium]